ncbi:DUF6049 family protein [Streptomyces sp. NBC_01187]|uniref:DUF6049 family protein n=1 Tax=Streptomyces sp. NBC_01187 TaxID=2903766 RepID=UPI0038630E45|nr:DUF6049 family protein [Streptomyces sp. NBC_01187]
MDERVAEAAESQAPPGPGGTNRTGETGAAPRARKRSRLWNRRAATLVLAALPVLAGILAPSPVIAASSAAAAPATAAEAASKATASSKAAASSKIAAGSTIAAGAKAKAGSKTTARSGTGSRSAEVSLNEVTPSVPKAGDTLTLTGTVTNTSRSTLSAGRLNPRIGPTLNSRSAIEQASRRKGYLSGADGNEVAGKHSVKLSGMAPGVTRSFTLKIPVSDLDLGPNGVYQLGVSLTAHTRARPYDQILGIGRTFLPWQRSDARHKSQLTYLWPLISTPRLTARTESDEQQTPVLRDDEPLIKELRPGGRLQQMVELGDDLPITWVIDPDLVATVDMMTRRYRVEKPGTDETKAGKGQEYASRWLNDLQKAVRGEEVVALPFADPDLASLAHRGKDVRGALSSLGSATTLGRRAVGTVLHIKPSTDFAWPYEGAVDSSIVDVATSAGAHNVIARSDSVRDSGLSYSPTAARPIGSGNTALVADARLSTAFRGDMSRSDASSHAVQQFVAQSLALSSQVPDRTRSVVVAPQRTPSVSQAQAMAEGIQALTGSGRWTQAGSLSDAAEAEPDPGAQNRMPSPASYPASLRKTELPTSAFEQVRRTKETLDDFKVILSRADRVVPPFGNAIDREVSNSWRGDSRGATGYRNGVQRYLLSLKRGVRLIQKSDITLSGREATIPVTVQNNLFQHVDGLDLELRSSRIGLDVGEVKRVRVDGEHSQSLKFDAAAKTNGRASVVAQLYTKEGKPYGKPMKFQVHVTSITSTVLLVIAGGVLLMVLAGIRMYTQRKRTGPPPDPDAPLELPDEDGDGDGDTEDGSGEKGEPDDEDESGDQDESGDESGNKSGDEDKSGDEEGSGDEDAGDPKDGKARGADAAGDGADTVRQNNNPPGAGEKVDR